MFLCRFSTLCCGCRVVFPSLGFILLFFFIENPPSHIDIGVRLKLRKKLHRKCLTGLKIHLCIGTVCNRKMFWEMPHSQFCILPLYEEKGLLCYVSS